MKYFFLITLLCVTVFSCFSQCILLKVDLNDCITCRSGMLKLQPALTGLPVYAVFPKNARLDSADIDFAGRFTTSKIKMKFNDVWFKKLACKQGRTCAFGLDKFGNVVFESPVDKLDSNALENYLSSNKASDEEPDGALFAFKDSLQFKFNDALARLVVSNRYTNKILYTIKSSTLDLSLISNSLSGVEKEKFLKYGTRINKEMTAYISRFKSFRLVNDSTIMMCLSYYNTPDSISSNITDEYALIEYSMSGKLRNVIPLDMPDNIIIYSPSFIFNDKNTYFPFWKLDANHDAEPDDWNAVQYIGRFSMKDKKYIWDNPLPQKIPHFYSLRKTYNYLALTYCDYPYIISYLGNELTNLQTGKTIEIVPGAPLFKSIDLSRGGDSFDPNKERFHCYGAAIDAKKDEVIAVYKLDNSLEVNRYNKELKLISNNNISYDFIPGAKFIWVSIYPKINSIELRTKLKDEEFRLYYLPLDLFY
ncbi:MAG TPA: hypothetical protein VGD89_05230 [Flavipsychrobacter sp.]